MKASSSRVRSIYGCLAAITLLALPMTTISVQKQSTKKSGSLVVQGAKLFASTCAGCHGAAGKGGGAPSLKGLKDSNAKIASTINNGKKGGMPAFKSKLKPSEVNALVAYIKTLKK
jgi:mono/diheme cytochrome c family protein